jgi:Fur family zinc uptake transcriptional regulator
MGTTGFLGHDHSACIAQALATVEARCAAQALRFTDIRRQVLELLLTEHKALGAYDLLERLAEAGHRRQPPAVYRALAFLTEHGFAHKVERLNAYVACAHPGAVHAPMFLICKGCRKVAEALAPEEGVLGGAARAAGFAVENAAIEAEGTCPACLSAARGA